MRDVSACRWTSARCWKKQSTTSSSCSSKSRFVSYCTKNIPTIYSSWKCLFLANIYITVAIIDCQGLHLTSRFSSCAAVELRRHVDVRADRLQRVQRRSRPQDRSAATMIDQLWPLEREPTTRSSDFYFLDSSRAINFSGFFIVCIPFFSSLIDLPQKDTSS